MRFIRFYVEITDHAMGATWSVDKTYTYSNREFSETNIPDLERKFGREVIEGFAYHIGFFGRTVTISPVQVAYESRNPTLEEAQAQRRYRYQELRLVEKIEGQAEAPIPFPWKEQQA